MITLAQTPTLDPGATDHTYHLLRQLLHAELFSEREADRVASAMMEELERVWRDVPWMLSMMRDLPLHMVRAHLRSSSSANATANATSVDSLTTSTTAIQHALQPPEIRVQIAAADTQIITMDSGTTTGSKNAQPLPVRIRYQPDPALTRLRASDWVGGDASGVPENDDDNEEEAEEDDDDDTDPTTTTTTTKQQKRKKKWPALLSSLQASPTVRRALSRLTLRGMAKKRQIVSYLHVYPYHGTAAGQSHSQPQQSQQPVSQSQQPQPQPEGTPAPAGYQWTAPKLAKLTAILEWLIFAVTNGMLEKAMLADHHALLGTPSELRHAIKAISARESGQAVAYRMLLDDDDDDDQVTSNQHKHKHKHKHHGGWKRALDLYQDYYKRPAYALPTQQQQQQHQQQPQEPPSLDNKDRDRVFAAPEAETETETEQSLHQAMRFSRILKHGQSVLLSVSPNVTFPPPYLLGQLQEQERQLYRYAAEQGQVRGWMKTATHFLPDFMMI